MYSLLLLLLQKPLKQTNKLSNNNKSHKVYILIILYKLYPMFAFYNASPLGHHNPFLYGEISNLNFLEFDTTIMSEKLCHSKTAYFT